LREDISTCQFGLFKESFYIILHIEKGKQAFSPFKIYISFEQPYSVWAREFVFCTTQVIDDSRGQLLLAIRKGGKPARDALWFF